jgi:hypothetical protein
MSPAPKLLRIVATDAWERKMDASIRKAIYIRVVLILGILAGLMLITLLG